MTERLVVVGADAAGMSAASQARLRRGPDDLTITAFERGSFASYSACGIPYWVSGTVGTAEELIARTPEEHRERDINLYMRTEVVSIDVDAHTVRAKDLQTSREWDEPWDQLVIATGSTPIRPAIEGIHAPNVLGVQTLDDGSALHAALRDPTTKRVVVIGGGYIGLEVAEAVRQLGLQATVIDKSRTPVTTFDPDVGARIAEALRGLDIELVLGDGVSRIALDDAGRAVGVISESGREVPADVVVLGLGVRPNVGLAEAAGIPLGVSGGIAVNRRMQTQVPGVWAAGDCVESMHRLSGRRVVVALGTHANKQGRVTGINIGGGYATFPGVIGTAVTKVCDLEVARTGMSERECHEAGYSFVTGAVDSTTKAGYFPGAEPIWVKAIAERRSGRLLGAQIVGREGSAKRIDVLATAIWNEMTVDEVLSLDLSYAPPFSPVWDPVAVAARKAFAAVEADIASSQGDHHA